MDILQLRAELTELLEHELGQYTLPNGSLTPAVAVRASGKSLPASTSAEGLELVLVRDPDLQAIPQYDEAGALRSWTVLLVAWSDYVELEIAAARIIHAFAGSRSETLAVPKGTGPLHQMRVTIVTPSIPVSELSGPRVYRSGVYLPGVYE